MAQSAPGASTVLRSKDSKAWPGGSPGAGGPPGSDWRSGTGAQLTGDGSSGALGPEADGAVDPDDLAVEVRVLDDRLDQLGVLGRLSHPLGEGNDRCPHGF